MLIVDSYKQQSILCMVSEKNTSHACFYDLIYTHIYVKYEWDKDMEKQVFWWCKYGRKLIQLARYENLCQILYSFTSSWQDENLVVNFIYKSWIINLKK